MKKIMAILAISLMLMIPAAISDSAEMSVTVGSSGPTVDSVSINDADPTAGDTTQITITTQVSDTNGVDDIKEVSAEFTVGSPANGNNITTMKRSICTGVDTDTIECIATYDMQFYDDDLTYTITVTAKDMADNPHSNSDNFAYSELISLDLDVASISFGSMAIDETREILGDTEWGAGTATIQNKGNAVIDATISASDFSGSTDSFGAEQAEARFAALSYNDLTNTERTETGLDLSNGASQMQNVDFSLTIPVGALPESYISTVHITAVADA